MIKVKVKKELKEALDRISKEWEGGIFTLLKDKLEGVIFSYSENTILDNLTVNQVYEICKNGYELELTYEQIETIKYFESACKDCSDYGVGYQKGILRALEIHNIRVPGVNCND